MGFPSTKGFSFSQLSSSRLRLPRAGMGAFRIERLMRRDSLELIARAVTVLLAIVCVAIIALTARSLITTRLSVAKLINKLTSIQTAPIEEPVEGAEHTVTSSDLSVLTSRSVFGTLLAANPVKPVTAPLTTKEPLTLIGTFVTGGEPPYAIIEDDRKKTQDVFAVGETIFGNGTVKRIMVDRVEIERGGQIETLVLDQEGGPSDDSGPSRSGGDQVVIAEAEYTQALENLPLLLTQARAVPYFKDGKAQGLRLFAVKAGSFYERLGLKNGDVLKSINGNSLADLSQAMQLLEKLKSERSFSISVDRNSEPRELRYDIR